MDAVALAVIAGVVGAIAMFARHDRERLGESMAAWRIAADRLGAELGRSLRHGLTAQLGPVEVRAAVVAEQHRYTRVWARARVRPQARLAVGTRRRRLQHVMLDPQTAGWTDRPRHVAALWTRAYTERWDRVRAAWSKETGGPCHVVSDGHTVELLIGGVLEDPDCLVAAVELIARIADDDLGAADALAALPAATPLPGVLGVRLAPDDVIVEIEAHTSATLIRGTADAGVARVRVRSADELARLAAPWVTSELVAAYVASGAATLAVSVGETRLAWAKLELDRTRLEAGVAVVRRIATAGADRRAPYR